MDVVVEEDCNRAVAKIPTITLEIGLNSLEKSDPALHPAMTCAEDHNKLRDTSRK
jgi:hypothetical protein